MNEISYHSLQLQVDPRGVATITLARPAVMNAFDETMIAELTRVFSYVGSAPEIRVVVLAAAGKAFCAGADLHWMERASHNTHEANLADARVFSDMMQTISNCKKPLLARVQGAAYGGGVGLCCVCDIVFAAPAARFAVSEAKFGILPSVIGPYLNNAVGKRQALRLALTAEILDAARAAQIGLVHEVVEALQLDAAIEKAVVQLLANGPTALGEIKTLFNQLSVGEVDRQVQELTAQTIARVRSTAEAREGFAAFFAKRPAAWVRQ